MPAVAPHNSQWNRILGPGGAGRPGAIGDVRAVEEELGPTELGSAAPADSLLTDKGKR
eukprot:COSAG05_NODE_2813_length_2611_cov_1.736863_3_plen_58_part_00